MIPLAIASLSSINTRPAWPGSDSRSRGWSSGIRDRDDTITFRRPSRVYYRFPPDRSELVYRGVVCTIWCTRLLRSIEGHCWPFWQHCIGRRLTEHIPILLSPIYFFTRNCVLCLWCWVVPRNIFRGKFLVEGPNRIADYIPNPPGSAMVCVDDVSDIPSFVVQKVMWWSKLLAIVL